MNVSVIITSFNQRAYLTEAIRSVLRQSLQPCQIIVVDDASTDGSPETIAAYARVYPHLIEPIYHGRNQGVARSRNDALARACGDYVTYLDGDDRLLPDKLALEADRLLRTGADAVYSDYYTMDAGGYRTGRWSQGRLLPEGDIFPQVMGRRFPGGNLFRYELVNYRLWQEVGFYDEGLSLYEDWEMRVRLAHRLRFTAVQMPQSEIRRHHAGLSSAPTSAHLEAVEYIANKHAGLINALSPDAQTDVRRGLAAWRARLLRRAAQESLSARPQTGRARRVALDLYGQSLRYDARIDLRLLRRILQGR